MADECARVLYPQQYHRRLRFHLRTLFSMRETAIWLDLLHSDANLQACLEHEPEMAEKIHRPYRRAGIRPKTRLALLQDHIEVIKALDMAPLMARAYEQTVLIARFVDKKDQSLQLLLSRPAQFGKEGELALHLTEGDSRTRLYSACFSFRRTDGLRELDIGCMQGPANENGRQKIRDLTHNLHGLRPRSLILSTLRFIAIATDCDRLRMVGNDNHVYRSLAKRREIAFDYDAFCTDEKGANSDGADWLLPVIVESKPLSEVPSKKRAETNRRRALVNDIQDQVLKHMSTTRSSDCMSGS
ncbi:DUF535 family protein [Acidithiobacillus sp. M4-SHS-6]|uniref:DUF535 family protein n=1 Tax=Acidithiobacillus sp. M4-SHS-6 TaxID=3383024 RepID=UPI0039BE168B